MRLHIPRRNNVYGNSCITWDHWSVRLRCWLYSPTYHIMPFKLWMWLERVNAIIYGDGEDCWCGGYELGPDD